MKFTSTWIQLDIIFLSKKFRHREANTTCALSYVDTRLESLEIIQIMKENVIGHIQMQYHVTQRTHLLRVFWDQFPTHTEHWCKYILYNYYLWKK